MPFCTHKTTLRSAFAAAALIVAGAAHADFITAIDQFTITRNGNPFFTDSFGDNNAPPSAPTYSNGNFASYAVFGTPQAETGGKFYMDSAQGGYTLAGDGTARLRNINTLLTSTDPLSGAGLKPNYTFVVEGLFDLVATPDARDVYGIALKDRIGFTNSGQVWSLNVGRIGDGTLGVHLIMQDYGLGTISVIASAALDTGHDQILLQFDRDNIGNNLAHASFQYWDGGSANGGFFDVGDATIFQSQQWVRADFHTNQETEVVPEPASLALLALGLAGLGFSRRKKA